MRWVLLEQCFQHGSEIGTWWSGLWGMAIVVWVERCGREKRVGVETGANYCSVDNSRCATRNATHTYLLYEPLKGEVSWVLLEQCF